MRALGYWLLPEPPPRPLAPPAGSGGSGGDDAGAGGNGAGGNGAGGPPRAVRLPRSEWEATGRAGGIGALLNALSRLAL